MAFSDEMREWRKITGEDRPTVWVAQEPTPRMGTGWVPDLSPAERFGHISFVFDAGEKPWTDPCAAISKIHARMMGFNPSHDFILWAQSGDPASFWLIIQTLTARGFHRLHYLYYQREGYYIPICGDVVGIPKANRI